MARSGTSADEPAPVPGKKKNLFPGKERIRLRTQGGINRCRSIDDIHRQIQPGPDESNDR